MARFALTIFLSAFLLFQVQPLITKVILPWFGGALSVWTTCLLFFQVMLLGGYAYAYLITTRLSGRWPAIVHGVLLAASLAFLPIMPSDAWRTSTLDGDLVWRLLTLLTVSIGLPYFLLSSTGPLLQEAFRRKTGNTPYRLYALSNAGSLLALLSYPFVFEPQLTLHTQIYGWSIGYLVFALLCGWSVMGIGHERADAATGDIATPAEAGPSWADLALWLALAACGSSLLMATTNQLCQEVATVPFLWVVPLSIYLMTLIIAFDHERWYVRWLFQILLLVAVLQAAVTLQKGNYYPLISQILVHCGVLFVACMVCHGELSRAKPAARHASLFYLIVAAGGGLGGILVGLVAPLVLKSFLEYQLALAAAMFLGLLAAVLRPTVAPKQQDRRRRSRRSEAEPTWQPWRLAAQAGFGVCGVALTWLLMTSQQTHPQFRGTNRETVRNFFGVLRVIDLPPFDRAHGPRRELFHGRTRHGAQFTDPGKRRLKTAYYGDRSGVGQAIASRRRHAPDSLRIGVVGLGSGTMAAHGQPGDRMRFFEIDPDVVRLSQDQFTFLADSPATIDIAQGDGRIQLEQELARGEERFDILVVDAFTGDAVPIHLLTEECIALYRERLEPDGVLCVHTSNAFLDLSRVVRGLAGTIGWQAVRIVSPERYLDGIDEAYWVIVTDNREVLADLTTAAEYRGWTDRDPAPLVWTDTYASLWQVLKKSQ